MQLIEPKIVAVVVTYNRIALLKKCVQAIRIQTRRPEEIIVVNNNSIDGTLEWLKNQNDLTVITQKNLGGAGGFHTGIKRAYEKGYDWVWCMDDDVLPQQKALQELLIYNNSKKERIGFLASKVLWTDGSQCVMNQHPPETGEAIKQASFVSLLVSMEAIKTVGYPIKEFFIYYDDAEYTSRISKAFKCYYVKDSVVIHSRLTNDTISWTKIDSENSNKYFYAIRNYIFFNKKELSIFGFFKSAKEILLICIRAFAGIILPKKPGKIQLLLHLIYYIYWGFLFNPKIEKVDNN